MGLNDALSFGRVCDKFADLRNSEKQMAGVRQFDESLALDKALALF